MLAVAQTGNSEMVAIVTGNADVRSAVFHLGLLVPIRAGQPPPEGGSLGRTAAGHRRILPERRATRLRGRARRGCRDADACIDVRFSEVAEMVSVTLRFPGGRLATFTVSFNGADNDWYRVTSSTGEIVVDPGFRFETPTRAVIRRGGETTEGTYPSVDHFGGQIACFSDCILPGTPPECDGAEGLADVLVKRAIDQAAATGSRVTIDLPLRPHHPDHHTIRSDPRTCSRLEL